MSEALKKRADELLNALLDHDVGYEAQTGAAQIVDDLIAELQQAREERTALLATEQNLREELAALRAWKAKIIKASETAYGESAVRYKFSLTKSGKCMNTFPRSIDGRWFALTPAEDDGHIGHIARIAELRASLGEPVGSLLVGVEFGEELGDYDIEMNDASCEAINEREAAIGCEATYTLFAIKDTK